MVKIRTINITHLWISSFVSFFTNGLENQAKIWKLNNIVLKNMYLFLKFGENSTLTLEKNAIIVRNGKKNNLNFLNEI